MSIRQASQHIRKNIFLHDTLRAIQSEDTKCCDPKNTKLFVQNATYSLAQNNQRLISKLRHLIQTDSAPNVWS